MAGLTIAHVMQAHAQDAVDMARERFQVNLDFSEQSITRVERCLEQLHASLPRGFGRILRQRKLEAEAWDLAKMWGGYVGEVVRRRWGGEWATASSAAGTTIVLCVLGSEVYPTAKVYGRLTNGAVDGITTYYQTLRKDFARLEHTAEGEELFSSELRRPSLLAAKRSTRRPPPIPSR